MSVDLVNTQVGQIHVSTPVATAFHLVRYPEHSGFLSNAAAVLHDLAERLEGGERVRVAEVEGEVAYAQRLGYRLERVGRPEPAGPLADWVARRPRGFMGVVPGTVGRIRLTRAVQVPNLSDTGG